MNLKTVGLCALSPLFILQSGAQSNHLPARYLHHFQSLEDSAVEQPHPTIFGVNTGWGLYKDIMFPGTTIRGKLAHKHRFLPGNRVLSCRITGGDAYNNLFFTSTLARKWRKVPWAFTTVNTFSYSLDFYINSFVDCIDSDNSEPEGLEFIFQQAMPPVSFLWGLQWSKNNTWSYWDDQKFNGRARGWVPLAGIHPCMLSKEWNQLVMTGHRTGDSLYYEGFHLNGSYFALNAAVPAVLLPVNWADNYLQVGIQLNGNKATRQHHRQGTDPVEVLLNNVTLLLGRRE